MTNVRFAKFAVVGAVLIFLFAATPALAATFTVTKVADTNDGVCDADCSLREAIGAANALPVADVITVPAGSYILSIGGTGEDLNATGDLDITGDLTINGAGDTSTIIDGGAIDRVLTVIPATTVLIDSITIRNGNPGAGFGAGGILNVGTLTLTKSTVTDNTGDDFGGGLYNTGTLTLIDTTVSDNILLGSNTSGGGGGIFSSGTLTLTRSTVSSNSTIGRGGGIYNLDLTATITNSTVSGNTALNGGGIFNRFGTVNLVSSTISGNTATSNGGGIWNFGGTTSLKNTIVSGNTAPTTSDDCAGTITSLGHNIASDASCAFAGAGDINSTDPLLGPLADNGGPTMTHALLSGSPAIDGVPLAFCTVTTDQRGVPRPQGPDCDIGAFELETCSLIAPPPGYTLQNGTPGNDVVILPPFTMFKGNGGNDTVMSNKNGNYIVCTLAGNDVIKLSGAGIVTIDAGNGKNTVVLGNMTGFITTGTGDDVISAGNGARTIDAGDGRNSVSTGNGNQTITTGSGNDIVSTNGGNDTIDVGAGANKVFSKGGADSLTALGGNDFFDAGAGADTCSAGGGANIVLNCTP